MLKVWLLVRFMESIPTGEDITISTPTREATREDIKFIENGALGGFAGSWGEFLQKIGDGIKKEASKEGSKNLTFYKQKLDYVKNKIRKILKKIIDEDQRKILKKMMNDLTEVEGEYTKLVKGLKTENRENRESSGNRKSRKKPN
jgi:hypothetical protein